MSRKPIPAPDTSAAAAAPEAAIPLPMTGGAWIIVDGQLVRDPAEMPPADTPANPPSTEA
jgi:hypothetical protein